MKIFEILEEMFDSQVQAMQKELKAAGEDLGPYGLNNDGIDGWLGPYTRRAAERQPSIAKKYQTLLSKKDTATTTHDTSVNSTFEKASAYTDKDGSVVIGDQRRSGGTISWRTNNPGNVMYGGFAKSYGAIGKSTSGDGEPVAIMPSLGHGIKMQAGLWRRPAYNNGTIDQGCRRWAGGVGAKKETSQYTIDLAKAAGATINTRVADLSDNQLANMVKAQMRWEGFKPGKVTQV